MTAGSLQLRGAACYLQQSPHISFTQQVFGDKQITITCNSVIQVDDRKHCPQCTMLMFSTSRVGLGHGVGVDHLSDQLHCVVQQLSSPDVSSGSGSCLFKLSQQVTGFQSPLRQRCLHSGNTVVIITTHFLVPTIGIRDDIFIMRSCSHTCVFFPVSFLSLCVCNVALLLVDVGSCGAPGTDRILPHVAH